MLIEEIKNRLEELGYDVVYHASVNIIQFISEHLEKKKRGTILGYRYS